MNYSEKHWYEKYIICWSWCLWEGEDNRSDYWDVRSYADPGQDGSPHQEWLREDPFRDWQQFTPIGNWIIEDRES